MSQRHPFDLSERERDLQRWAFELASKHSEGEADWEAETAFPAQEVAALGRDGLLRLTHPGELGGDDGSRLDAMLAIEGVARASFTLAEVVQIAINGPAYVLSVLASEDVRRRYVPPVMRGETLISIAITEEEAGSSLADTSTSAVRNDAGEVVVNGTKCFVTGGSLSSAHLVMVRFGGEGLNGLGYVLVPADADGCVVSRTYEKMGGNAIPEAVVDFEDCVVPADHVIIDSGAQSKAGFRQAMTTYNAMRVGIAAICCGVAGRAIDLTVDHMNTRKQSGRPLARFQGLRWRVAELATDLEAARLLTYRAARMSDDNGFPPARETALAKLRATDVAVRAADNAIQTLGWRGVVRAEGHPAERIFREVRGWTIAGGTTEALLNFVASDVIER